MGDIYHTDFRRKELLHLERDEEILAYKWHCDVCRVTYTYDSRKEKNVRHISFTARREHIHICEACVKEAYKLVTE